MDSIRRPAVQNSSMINVRKQPRHSPNRRVLTPVKRLWAVLQGAPWRSALLLAVPFLFCVSGSSTRAASESTNWEGLIIELNMPKTNFLVGEQILASIIVSNALRSECLITSLDRDPCRAGFGEFLIFEERSGRRIHCAIPMNERIHGEEKQHRLIWHEAKEFAAELVGGYAMTNAGTYTIRAMGKFRLVERPDKHCTAITPPIVISLSNGVEARAPAEMGPATISSTDPPAAR